MNNATPQFNGNDATPDYARDWTGNKKSVNLIDKEFTITPEIKEEFIGVRDEKTNKIIGIKRYITVKMYFDDADSDETNTLFAQYVGFKYPRIEGLSVTLNGKEYKVNKST